MLHSKTLLFDQLTPISIFTKLKEYFKDELTFLFESAINSEDGNYSFLFIGALERVILKDDIALHVNEDGVQTPLNQGVFPYLKVRYKELNPQEYN